MEGSVYVTYDGIGGSNMNYGIMTADLTGSSSQDTEGEVRPTYNVAWILPGGITNGTGGQGGEWGYLLKAQVDGGNLIGDKELIDYFQSKGYLSWDGQNTDTVVFSSEESVRNELNSMLNSYIRRLMQYSVQYPESDLGMTRFLQEFQGCVTAL